MSSILQDRGQPSPLIPKNINFCNTRVTAPHLAVEKRRAGLPPLKHTGRKKLNCPKTCLLLTPLQKVYVFVGPTENILFPKKLVQRPNQIAIKTSGASTTPNTVGQRTPKQHLASVLQKSLGSVWPQSETEPRYNQTRPIWE